MSRTVKTVEDRRKQIMESALRVLLKKALPMRAIKILPARLELLLA